jgi:hypothetical protein
MKSQSRSKYNWPTDNIHSKYDWSANSTRAVKGKTGWFGSSEQSTGNNNIENKGNSMKVNTNQSCEPKKRSNNWSSEWNTVHIDMNVEQNDRQKKRKFGTGWDDKSNSNDSNPDNSLFVFSLSNKTIDQDEMEEKEENSFVNVKKLPKLPIDPLEVLHCPSWHAKRLQRCKLATTKPCGKHVIFEV